MKIIKRFQTVAFFSICCCIISQRVSAQQKSNLSDPEIAKVAVVANQIDIDNANIAKEKSQNNDVKNFAQTMINDHTSVINQATALVKKLNVTPKDNATSKQLLSDAQKTQSNLRSKSGSAFDKAYIDNEVAYHQAVINTVQNVLIPEAKNSELKQLLQNVLPTLKTHLEHAQMLQKNLSGR
jgi:putative membrane protein